MYTGDKQITGHIITLSFRWFANCGVFVFEQHY